VNVIITKPTTIRPIMLYCINDQATSKMPNSSSNVNVKLASKEVVQKVISQLRVSGRPGSPAS